MKKPFQSKKAFLSFHNYMISERIPNHKSPNLLSSGSQCYLLIRLDGRYIYIQTVVTSFVEGVLTLLLVITPGYGQNFGLKHRPSLFVAFLIGKSPNSQCTLSNQARFECQLFARCSDKGLTIEISALETLYGGQFTSTQSIKPNYVYLLIKMNFSSRQKWMHSHRIGLVLEHDV